MTWLPLVVAAFSLLLVALAVYLGHRLLMRGLTSVETTLSGVKDRLLEPEAVKAHLDGIARSATLLETRSSAVTREASAAADDLRAEASRLHASVAALDFAGIKSTFAGLQVAVAGHIAKLHADLAAIQSSMEGVALAEVQAKVAEFEKHLAASEPGFCRSLAEKALVEQVEYERGHEERQRARMAGVQKNKSLLPERYDYDPDQRREAVLQRLARLYAAAGRPVPQNAGAIVDELLAGAPRA